jgi:hypothetical protein
VYDKKEFFSVRCFSVLCVYKNWVHTEEISYTYHDKSGRLHRVNNIVAQTTHQYAAAQVSEVSPPGSKVHEIQSLQEAQKKIKELAKKMKELVRRIPQRYPDVKYLNYRSRRRILVSTRSTACMQPVQLHRMLEKSPYPYVTYHVARVTLLRIDLCVHHCIENTASCTSTFCDMPKHLWCNCGKCLFHSSVSFVTVVVEVCSHLSLHNAPQIVVHCGKIMMARVIVWETLVNDSQSKMSCTLQVKCAGALLCCSHTFPMSPLSVSCGINNSNVSAYDVAFTDPLKKWGQSNDLQLHQPTTSHVVGYVPTTL